jgi:hypothetical protein
LALHAHGPKMSVRHSNNVKNFNPEKGAKRHDASKRFHALAQ